MSFKYNNIYREHGEFPKKNAEMLGAIKNNVSAVGKKVNFNLRENTFAKFYPYHTGLEIEGGVGFNEFTFWKDRPEKTNDFWITRDKLERTAAKYDDLEFTYGEPPDKTKDKGVKGNVYMHPILCFDLRIPIFN